MKKSILKWPQEKYKFSLEVELNSSLTKSRIMTWSYRIQKDTWTIKTLLVWMKDNMLKERPELFIQGNTVRPGILVLINDTDWELMGELDYEIQDSDTVVFISTLHGG